MKSKLSFGPPFLYAFLLLGGGKWNFLELLMQLSVLVLYSIAYLKISFWRNFLIVKILVMFNFLDV